MSANDQRMSAAELRAEFRSLHQKLDRLAKAIASPPAPMSGKTHVHNDSGDLTFIKGTGSLAKRDLSAEAQAALSALEANDVTEPES